MAANNRSRPSQVGAAPPDMGLFCVKMCLFALYRADGLFWCKKRHENVIDLGGLFFVLFVCLFPELVSQRCCRLCDCFFLALP
jgi:hypothetical protein